MKLDLGPGEPNETSFLTIIDVNLGIMQGAVRGLADVNDNVNNEHLQLILESFRDEVRTMMERGHRGERTYFIKGPK